MKKSRQRDVYHVQRSVNISNKIIFSRVDMDSEGPISKGEVLRQIGSAQELLKTASPNLNEHIYNAMTELSNSWLNNKLITQNSTIWKTQQLRC